MTALTTKPADGSRVLAQVGEVMPVFNSMQEKIGTVEANYLGAVSDEDERSGTGAAKLDGESAGERPFLSLFEGLFEQNRVSNELVERLRYSGFIRVDVVGFFGSDRFVTPDQIEHVSKDGVHLKVPEAPRIVTHTIAPMAVL